MNVHQLNLLNVQQQSNSTVRLQYVRQLLLHVAMFEADQQRTNDDDLQLRRLTSLDQVAIKLVIVDLDVKKTT